MGAQGVCISIQAMRARVVHHCLFKAHSRTGSCKRVKAQEDGAVMWDPADAANRAGPYSGRSLGHAEVNSPDG